MALVLGFAVFQSGQMPISWIGKAPDVNFVSIRHFAEPSIDLNLPLGRFTYPRRMEVENGKVNTNVICGLIEKAQDELVQIRDGDYWFTLPTFTTRPEKRARVKLLSGLPYATEESSRVTDIRIGQQQFRVKLPLRKYLGVQPRLPEHNKGGFSLRLEYRPWRYSTAPQMATYQPNLPAGHSMLLTKRGTSYLLPLNPLTTTIRPGDDPQGDILILKEIRFKLKVNRQNSVTTLRYPNGLPFPVDSGGFRKAHPKFHFMLCSLGWVRSREDQNLPVGASYLEKFGLGTPEDSAKLKDGDEIDAIGFMVLDKWSFRIKVPTPPMNLSPHL